MCQNSTMRNARTKQRQVRHITGDQGVDLVRRKLPDSWVVRDIYPDYGLDLHVEVFETDLYDLESANTLGEHFYIQVKTAKEINIEKITVRSRRNITKFDPNPKLGAALQIEVVKFSIDTETLLTVESMGSAVPVLLCYVDLKTDTVYYVCLNDYISKSLLPYKPLYEQQRSVTIDIPAWNVLDQEDPSFAYVCLLARRSKYYAAFNTFVYQYNEILIVEENSSPLAADAEETVYPDRKLITMVRNFLRAALRLAVWSSAGVGYWSPLGEVHNDFVYLQKNLPNVDRALSESEYIAYVCRLIYVFERAASLGRMYEELVREWRQPSYLAAGMDYSDGNKFNPPLWDSPDLL